jgi:hypothetical protein
MSEIPIWSAALRAVGCRATRGDQSDLIEWELHADHARYEAAENLVVEPFGVKLSPGDVLEVRWAPNDSGYELTVKRPSKPARRGRRTLQ